VGGIDLVEWMIRVAAGTPPALGLHRHVPQPAIQARVYRKTARGFRPSSSLLTACARDLRVASWIGPGTEVSAYDPLLAKIIARGARAKRQLATAQAWQPPHPASKPMFPAAHRAGHPAFLAGQPTTRLLDRMRPCYPASGARPRHLEHYPGLARSHCLWDVGIRLPDPWMPSRCALPTKS
jgi:urea carboxylase